VDELVPFGLAQATPDSIGLLDAECVLAALLDDGAAGAQRLGGFLTALAAHAALGLW
jgi:hypothetical protein